MSCLAELGRKVSADYVAQARIGRFEKNLTIGVELYSSRSGSMVGSFTGDSKSLRGLRDVINEKAPLLFKKIPGVSEKEKPTPPPVATTTPPTPPAPVTPQELKPTPPQKRYSPPPPPIPKDVPPEEPEPVASATPIHGNSYIGGNSYKNFTTGQRWGTYALNLTINGLGSLVVMGDVFGAAVHFGFGIGALPIAYYIYRDPKGVTKMTTTEFISDISFALGICWNIYRSYSYDKPRKVANGKYEGFNVAVLPNRRGEFMPYVFYNKGF